MRGRLDREYDMKIQPLSFAISDPAKAPEEESLLEAKNCKVVKKRTNRDLCTAVMKLKNMYLGSFVLLPVVE